MGCAVVCAAGAGALDGVAAVVLMVFGFAVAAALAAAVVSVLAGYAWVLAAAVLVANVAMGWAVVRVWKYGPTLEVFRRHRAIVKVPPRNLHNAVADARRVELPAASPLAIEAGRIEVTPDMVLGKIKEEAR